MRLVIIESPYAPMPSEVEEAIQLNEAKGLPVSHELAYKIVLERNLAYLRSAMRDCLVNHNESPYASHGLYTQPGILDDEVLEERELGIEAGFCWRGVAELTVVYQDLGISRGMRAGIADAESKGREIRYRNISLTAAARETSWE